MSKASPKDKKVIESNLERHAKRFKKRVEKVTEGIYCAVGYALSNSILIVTEAGNVIVDTTESIEAANEINAEFKKISPKKTITVIYTHGHHDHVHGTSAFIEENTEIYANQKTVDFFNTQFSQLEPIITKRSLTTFGFGVPSSYFPCSGLGPEYKWNANDPPKLIFPTKTFNYSLNLTIGELKLELVSAPGETDDHIFIWIPLKKVLLSADNYYPSFPNLYTLRGTAPRPIQQWINSLDKMRDLNADFLVPGHAEPIYGSRRISEILTMYRDAIQYVHDSVIRGMNNGETPEDLAENVQLPPHLVKHDELLELYGDISQSVRAIYYGYLGWFDGNATNLKPLSKKIRAKKIIELIGFEQVLTEAKQALSIKEFQWASELSDMILAVSPGLKDALHVKSDALYNLGINSQNSNNRGYYLSQSWEIAGKIKRKNTISLEKNLDYIKALPIDQFFSRMSIMLDPILSQDHIISACVRLKDENTSYIICVRKGIAEIRKGVIDNPDLLIETKSLLWKEIIYGVQSVDGALESNQICLQGDNILLEKLVSLFKDD